MAKKDTKESPPNVEPDEEPEDAPEAQDSLGGETTQPGDEEEFHFDPDAWEDIPQEEASRLLRGLESLIPDIVKRAVVSGMGQTILSEEGLRSLVADKNLPKEAVGFLLSQADATRKEILRIVSREIRVFLENMDFGGEIAKILTSLSFEIRTEIRFIPNEERVSPSVKNRVKIRRAVDGETLEATAGGPEEVEESDEGANERGARGGRGRSRWTRRKKKDEEKDELE